MSVTKEKYIGESVLKRKPKKAVSLKIKEGSITSEKLSDGSVTLAKAGADLIKYIKDLSNPMSEEEVNEYIETKAVTKDDVDSGLTYTGDGKLRVNAIGEDDADTANATDDSYYTSAAIKKLLDSSTSLTWYELK